MNPIIEVLILSLLLGIKHSIEPDHVIAVSTIVTKSKKIDNAMKLGLFWGLGHTAVLFVIGGAFILLKGTVSESISSSLEVLVGFMLIYFGFKALTSPHGNHSHQDLKSGYFRSILMGVIHGLSGSGALIILTMSTVKTPLEGINFILIFGFGTILGMMASTTMISLPFVATSGTEAINKKITVGVSIISILYGVYYTLTHLIAVL